jgi:LmbE family N-acetylglucosaminyl deacetylase
MNGPTPIISSMLNSTAERSPMRRSSEQSLRRLSTTASLMMIVAHPDDEDGALLTYLSRGLGVRCTLLTLTRGEGGQNAMSAETYDALGLIRTNELLKADEYYGAKQLWGTEIDFGFSKTQEEAFARWGHDRVLYDAVLAVRRERPQVIVSTFVGGITDGHGHHQVSGEIAQEVFKAAADPKRLSRAAETGERRRPGLTVAALAVYSMVPSRPSPKRACSTTPPANGRRRSSRTTSPARSPPASLHRRVPSRWARATPPRPQLRADRPRQGWGSRSRRTAARSQPQRPASTSYHLWAVAPQAAARTGANQDQQRPLPQQQGRHRHHVVRASRGSPAPTRPHGSHEGLQQNSTPASRSFRASEPPQPRTNSRSLTSSRPSTARPSPCARVAPSNLDPQAKASLLFELDTKSTSSNPPSRICSASISSPSPPNHQRPGRRLPRRRRRRNPLAASLPGEEFNVRIHTAHAAPKSTSPKPGSKAPPAALAARRPHQHSSTTHHRRHLQAPGPDDAQPTQPYFTRPNIEQPYYDLTQPEYRERSFAPWPLAAWAEFTFDGLPIRIGQVVQTMQRVLGPGGVYEPLVVTPAIGVRMDPKPAFCPSTARLCPSA